MYIEFDKEYLRELYTDGKTSDKKHRYQPEVVRGYQKVVVVFEQIVTICRLLDISNHYK